MPSSSRRITASGLANHAHLQCDLYLHQSYHGASSADETDQSLDYSRIQTKRPGAIILAAVTSGDAWESALFTHLDQHGLLLTNKGPPLSGGDIASVIQLDERPHFFVAGLSFWAPQHELTREYLKRGVAVQDVPRFGLTKPDLVEIWRETNGNYVWRIIDAKASKEVKTSHLVQTYFYHLCLTLMLPSSFIPAPTVAIWLPSGLPSPTSSDAQTPSLMSLHPTPVSPLVAPLSHLLFNRLPAILSSARSAVPWHFNPLCRSCAFAPICRARVEKEGGLGMVGEMTLREAGEVRSFVKLTDSESEAVSKRLAPEFSSRNSGDDIEDLVPSMTGLAIQRDERDTMSELAQLAVLLDDDRLMKAMEKKWPASAKRVNRILGIQPRDKSRPSSRAGLRDENGAWSPVIEAASTKTPQFTNRRVYTLPSSEDIAIYVSLIIDPSHAASLSNITEFCITTQIMPSFKFTARKHGFKPLQHVHGNVEALIPALAKCIRAVLGLHAQVISETGPGRSAPGNENLSTTKEGDNKDLPLTQFYTWSVPERDAIQKHLVNAALESIGAQAPIIDDNNTSSREDIRLCIGALCEGASLLATAFQPHVLEGALLSFLGKKGQGKEKMKAVMRRLGIELKGEETADAMRQRIVSEIERMSPGGTQHRRTGRKTVGLLPRVVVLKKELRRLVAIPVAGWWDVKEAATSLSTSITGRCPDENELFRRHWDGEGAALKAGFEERNDTLQGLVEEVRRKVRRLPGKRELLVNRATVLSADWVDVCQVEVLRKLFYMQQFEVLLKLQELWEARIEGCPDAPLLMYRSTTDTSSKAKEIGDERKSAAYLHSFDLIAGNLEMAPERDRDRSFFDFILVEECDGNISLSNDDATGDSGCNQLPVEALFDDLCVSGLVFPLNRYTRGRWEDGQVREVREGRLWVADVKDVRIEGGKTEVLARVWSNSRGGKSLSPGRKYRLSPRLIDFNTSKVLSTLVELDLQADSPGTPIGQGALPLFTQLISNPKTFGGHDYHAGLDPKYELRRKVVLDAEASLHRLYTELRELGNEDAGALVLKSSQRRATRRILGERLTVIWGPPGSGKSYTIALSLLRMLEVQARTHSLAPAHQQIIFLTAMTHAAIQACLSKLRKLIERYRSVPDLSLEWLEQLSIEHVLKGSEHPKPVTTGSTPARVKTRASEASESRTWIYAGTVYQLYTFGKRLSQGVDCVVIDEAGQLGLGAASLVLRALSQNGGAWSGKVVVAGDREQLAPIFSGKYPELTGNQRILFGSVLDCLMGRDDEGETFGSTGVTTPDDKSVGTIVQLLENFRLNPDLGNFVQTIYKRAFKPQKVQAKKVASQLRRLEDESFRDVVLEKARALFIALSQVMLGKEQALFQSPVNQDTTRRVAAGAAALDTHGLYADPTPNPRPISLALLRLRVYGDRLGERAYESHVRAEAKVAAALVRLLGVACCSAEGDSGDDIFVACPHRVQRAAVKAALNRWDESGNDERGQEEDEDEELERLIKAMRVEGDIEEEKGRLSPSKFNSAKAQSHIPVIIDTIERLQGSEASFVICLFSHTHHGSLSTALPFLLARRRLNVAISRAKTLCIVIASEGVLRPDVSVFADQESARGYAFLRAFEERAWSADIVVELEE